ncbi:MAG: MBL fold metallo-hydrolase [bacterium]|nr:MBL fold metallo-hydrolase [bacterium]
MKIKFLGTSAGWPLPRLGCQDKICSSTDPKDTRTRSQAIVNDKLLLDIGPDTYQHLKTPGLDPTKTKYAAISHEHPDHTFGLWDLGHIYNSEKIKVILNEETYRKIKKLFFYKEYEILILKDGQKIIVDGLELSLLRVNHTTSSFGVSIKEKTKRLFWAPDFKALPSATQEELSGADLIAMDGSELNIKSRNHQTIKEGISLGKTLKAKKIYFTHIGHRTLPHRELEGYVQREGANFQVAYDGQEIEI